MDGEVFLGIIIVVFIIMVNIAKAKKQQKAKEAAPPLNAGRKTAAPETEPRRTFSAPVPPGFEGYDPCHEEQLSGMPPRAGDEGFDPCHEEPPFSVPVAAPEMTDAEREENAQELLRGIIIGEVLRRRQPLRR